jgi:hypothetical protein
MWVWVDGHESRRAHASGMRREGWRMITTDEDLCLGTDRRGEGRCHVWSAGSPGAPVYRKVGA